MLEQLLARLRGLATDWEIGRDEDRFKTEVGKGGLKLTEDAWNACIQELEAAIKEYEEEQGG